MLSEVLSPQPHRPLKRRFLDEDIRHETLSRTKRTLLDLFPAPDPASRCHSDSLTARTRSPDSDSSSSACGLTRSPVSYREGASSPATTASLSFSEESRSSSRVSSPTYRHDLFHSNIEIDPDQVSRSVLDYGRQIITRTRYSPGLQESQAQNVVNVLRSLKDADEDTIRSGYKLTQLLPGTIPYSGKIMMGSNIPFDPTSLPHVPPAPPLAVPRPGQHYCLDRGSFSIEEDNKQSVKSLRRLARPSTTGCWPYFTVEFKSEAQGGTFWVAENQNAVSGSLCVNSMEKLLSIVQSGHTEFDSVSFSCNISSSNADIWIHYCQNQRFFSAELEHFHMRRWRDVICFRNSVKNIVEFGWQERLPQISALLAKISLYEILHLRTRVD
ncbi:hypothetical protein H2202_007558 [Exophiala xenobiotica]|nr:hypothetical protein H2202_007558 [Exophiala xenobiotica]